MKELKLTRHVTVFIAWFDCWLGVYYNQQKRRLYIMIPFVGMYFE